MVVKIRLARFGRPHQPLYNIVVTQARYIHAFLTLNLDFGAFEVANGSSPGRTALGSKPMEVLGTYDPIPKPDSYDSSGKLHKDIRLDITRTKYWVGVGAQPTDVVWKLLTMVRSPPLKEFSLEHSGPLILVQVMRQTLLTLPLPPFQLGILEPKQAAKPKYTPPPNYKLSSTGKRIS